MFTSAHFHITSGKDFHLKDHPTELKEHFSKDELKDLLADDRARIGDGVERSMAIQVSH